MPDKKTEAPEHPDAGMIREGSPEGGPSVRFSPEARCNYHLNSLGERVYHGVPDGFHFTATGNLLPNKPTVDGAAADKE